MHYNKFDIQYLTISFQPCLVYGHDFSDWVVINAIAKCSTITVYFVWSGIFDSKTAF